MKRYRHLLMLVVPATGLLAWAAPRLEPARATDEPAKQPQTPDGKTDS